MTTFEEQITMAESKHGGAREGSGRKPKAPTKTINFRVPADKAPVLKPLVSAYIKGLLKTDDAPITQVRDQKPAPIKTKEAPVKKITEKEPTMAELLRQLNKSNQGL